MEFTFLGMDSWDRPVYQDEMGQLWKDVDPRIQYAPSLNTADEFDGEPGYPMNDDVEVEFVPRRITWD